MSNCNTNFSSQEKSRFFNEDGSLLSKERDEKKLTRQQLCGHNIDIHRRCDMTLTPQQLNDHNKRVQYEYEQYMLQQRQVQLDKAHQSILQHYEWLMVYQYLINQYDFENVCGNLLQHYRLILNLKNNHEQHTLNVMYRQYFTTQLRMLRC